MRLIFGFFLSFSLLFSSSLDNTIHQKNKELKLKKIEYRKMDKKLSKIAKKILTAKKEQSDLEKKIASLEKNIKNNEEQYINLKKEGEKLSKDLNRINSKIASKQDKFVGLVAKNFSMALALEELKEPTKDSVIMQEMYEVYAKRNSVAIENLKREIISLNKKQASLKEKEGLIKLEIATYTNERLDYTTKKKEKEKLIKALARDKALYKKRFNRIKKSRRSLERKLAKLKIIKQEQKDAIEAKRLKAKNRKDLEVEVQNNRDSSVSIASYRGGKTISPLKGSRLIKKFGTYIDPIYKFKIFNKSITLKAPYSGSKVRNVLKGKVVFSENSGGMLGRVVIIEHARGIHTIYAKLSRLAPGIYVGKQLSKGSVIGKVDKSLMFEVTKDNKHMNPLKLIHL
ncbi:Putative periplasmic protein [hydrothermal vent metagenome]|uniref:Putative periplasmic protein n=1 Tax=hydrothermal vent metagenome TaxID=652676 RepID=A0A1W1C7S0_9ZZZZ